MVFYEHGKYRQIKCSYAVCSDKRRDWFENTIYDYCATLVEWIKVKIEVNSYIVVIVVFKKKTIKCHKVYDLVDDTLSID